MIYALLIFNAETGANVASIDFSSGKGINIEDGTVDLMSGVVRAISDFLNELKLGQIRNFETREKNVLVVKSGSVIAALVCDIGSNIEIYNVKLKLIAEEFRSATTMSGWHGNADAFGPAMARARKIIVLTDEDVKAYLSSALVNVAQGNGKILGFKIFQGVRTVGGDFKDLPDTLIASLLHTSNADAFYQDIADLGDIALKYMTNDVFDVFYANYGRFALLRAKIFQDISIILVLDKSISIGVDIPAICDVVDKLRRF